MFYIALCDDNPFDLSELSADLAELKDGGMHTEILTYVNGPSLVEEYERGRRFHLLVLDMLMEPIDGIETAKRIRKYDASVPILIVTSTVQYALDGYQVNAWRYLMKPVDKAVFVREVRDILKKQEAADAHYYIVSNEQGITKVRLDDILYFESDQHTIRLHTLAGEHVFRGALGDIEEKLAPQHFVRIHKSYLVNLRYVKTVFKNSIRMENGDEVFVSKYRSARLYEELLNYTEQTYEHAGS